MPSSGNDESPDNVVVIVLDTVRARSSYPQNRRLTPTLASVGDRGTTFHRAIAPATWTLPSHASMFTGSYPAEHGATSYNKKLESSDPTLAQRLGDSGLRTGLFSGNAWLSDTFGLARGFDVRSFSQRPYYRLYDEGIDCFGLNGQEDREHWKIAIEHLVRNPSIKNIVNCTHAIGKEFVRRKLQSGIADLSHHWDRRAVAECTDFIRETARKNGPDRFFAVVNLIQAHLPWRYEPGRLRAIDVDPLAIAPKETWRKRAKEVDSNSQRELAGGEIDFDETDRAVLPRLYESWVHAADAAAGKIVQTLESENLREDTLLVMTADHGERIARNGVLGHVVTLHEDVTHVPLVVDGPTIPEENVRDIVSLKDIYGTILASVGIDSDKPHMFENAGRGVALSETNGLATFEPERQDLAGTKRAIVTEDGRAEIRYESDTTVGPPELVERLDEFVADLDRKPEREREQVTVGENLHSRLEHLGYMG